MSAADDIIDFSTPLVAGLTEAGLARTVDVATSVVGARAGGQAIDLIPLLVSDWRSAAVEQSDVAEWLVEQQLRGAALTAGYGGKHEQAARAWLGMRLAWWPNGIPSGRRVGVTSSRLGRRLDRQEAWFDVLRAACGKIDRRLDVLVSAGDTAAAALVRRAAELFELRLLTIETPTDDQISLTSWLEDVRQKTVDPDGSMRQAFLSPPLPGSATSDPSTEISGPFRDRALAALSDRLLVFHLRSGGNWQRILKRRLDDPLFPPASVYVAVGREMVSSRCAAQLLDAGAIGWVVPETLNIEREPAAEKLLAAGNTSAVATRARAQTIDVPTDEPWQYLTHCTRRCEGAWPGQAEDEYLEQLLMHSEQADRSALAALLRIIETRTLSASSAGIRGQSAVVCLTAVPLVQLESMRAFRPHRHRWDFEPYGICIRRDWLENLGARPVRYGNEQLWKSLPKDQQPFFQISQSTGGQQVIDWTSEREWRHVGDVDLVRVPAEAVFVFVPSEKEAASVAQISPWPVVMLGESDGIGPTSPKPR